MNNKKNVIGLLLLLALVPILSLLTYYGGDRRYYLISSIIILVSIMLTFFGFERRKPQAKDIVIIAVMAAIAAVSRMIFVAVPHFKPLAAIVIISGMALGAQAGFLSGAVACLASNFVFGQGPWTAWQMFAFGAAGFIAGFIFNDEKRQKRSYIAVYGFVSSLLIIGPTLDLSGVFYGGQIPDINAITAIFIAGISVNLIQSFATALFLFLLARPLLDKLNRIKRKYGILEYAEK